uniref:Glutathione transferase n=1 Tax=Tetradesmus obliquus TaxID=3088 RepID=A0A383WFY7_TETOB|eukprot:jgi/Sobl393_1/18628/SZX65365.1
MLAARTRPFTSAAPTRRAVVTHSSLKLYTNPASRGKIVEWYLQEIGVDAELVNLDLKERQHKTEDFMKVNPFGKVPAMQDGSLSLFESGALLTYLADKYGKLDTPEARARASQWVLFANSTLANSVFVEQFREKSMPDVMGNLDKILAGREFIEGDAFSVSDVAVGAYLLYIPAFLPQIDLSPYPNVVAYMQRMAARPACASTVAARATQRKEEEKAAAKN